MVCTLLWYGQKKKKSKNSFLHGYLVVCNFASFLVHQGNWAEDKAPYFHSFGEGILEGSGIN
jgi:hypothetical protein